MMFSKRQSWLGHNMICRTERNRRFSKSIFEVRHARLPDFEAVLRNFPLLVFLTDNRTGQKKMKCIRDIVPVESFHRIR